MADVTVIDEKDAGAIADWLEARLADHGIGAVVTHEERRRLRTIYRVRIGPLADVDEITARCEAEAKDNGITDPDEQAAYVKQCVAEQSAGQPGD